MLYYFKTPKRNFYRSCKNYREALSIFLREAGNNTVAEIAGTNAGFKQADCQRMRGAC